MDNKPLQGQQTQPPANWREKLVIILILVIVCGGVWVLLYPPAWLQHSFPTALPGVNLIADPYRGNPDAPVKIIEYNDFACMKCVEWHKSGVEEKVIQKYGDRVVFIWRDHPLTSNYSVRAAEAAQCANDQGRFWDYHDYLYEHAQGFMDEKLIEYAGKLGLDVKKFDQCLIGGEMESKLADSQSKAIKDRIQVVPTFLINGERIIGPASLEGLNRAVDNALK